MCASRKVENSRNHNKGLSRSPPYNARFSTQTNEPRYLASPIVMSGPQRYPPGGDRRHTRLARPQTKTSCADAPSLASIHILHTQLLWEEPPRQQQDVESVDNNNNNSHDYISSRNASEDGDSGSVVQTDRVQVHQVHRESLDSFASESTTSPLLSSHSLMAVVSRSSVLLLMMCSSPSKNFTMGVPTSSLRDELLATGPKGFSWFTHSSG